MATTYTELLQLPKHSVTDPFDITLINNMADLTDAGMKKAYQGKAAHNLLDNSYFPAAWVVNQEKKTTYTGSGYGIDRWRTNFSGDTVEVLAGGIRNTVNSTTSGWHMHQILEGGLLAGKSITAACYATAATGTLYLMISCRDSSDSEIDHGYKRITPGLCVASMNVPGGTEYIRVGVYAYSSSVAAGDNVTLQWAALYEGAYTANTLPDYQPKGKAAELAECLPHSVWTAGQGYGYCASTESVRLNIPVPTTMRVTPSIPSGLTFRVYAGGKRIDVTGYSVNNVYPGIVQLTLTGSFPATETVAGYATTVFKLDANM